MDVKYVYEEGIRMYQFSVFDPFTELETRLKPRCYSTYKSDRLNKLGMT